jgi:hypothetical protein
MKMSQLSVNDFRASIAQLGKGAIQADQGQTGLVQGSKGAWIKSLLNIGDARDTNARTLDALRQAVRSDPAYARVADQADAILGRLGSTFPLTGRKISQVLNKLDTAFARQTVQGNVPIKKTPASDLAAARETAGRNFASTMSEIIQLEMKKHLGTDLPTFEKDITRGGFPITIGGTTLQRLRDIPEASVLRPGETLETLGRAALTAREDPTLQPDETLETLGKDVLTARRKLAVIENGYNVFARLVTGRDDAVFGALTPADKTRALILASLSNQEMEKGATLSGLQSVAPHYMDTASSDGFAFLNLEDQAHRTIDIHKNPNGDFVIRCGADMPVNMAIFPNGPTVMLDATRSGYSMATSLTISGAEMDRLSTLNWNPGEGEAPPQTAFSEHSVIGEMRLFRAE